MIIRLELNNRFRDFSHNDIFSYNFRRKSQQPYHSLFPVPSHLTDVSCKIVNNPDRKRILHDKVLYNLLHKT